jgi:hypothetical protein
MAFTPEDGTGVTGANSYASLEAADTYLRDRNNVAWDAKPIAAKQAALLEATAYIDGTYSGRWPGTILKQTQGLSWPRADALDRDGRALEGVPACVMAATCELAAQAITGALAPAVDPAQVVKRQKAGSLELEYETSLIAKGKTYPFVRAILSVILPPLGFSVPLRRV